MTVAFFSVYSLVPNLGTRESVAKYQRGHSGLYRRRQGFVKYSDMSDTSVEAKISELSAKVDSLIFGYKVGALALLFLASLFNVGDTFSISHFRQIFQDALPGKPLPLLTNFLLEFQTLVTCLAVLWPALGLLSVFIFKKVSTTIIVITGLLIVVILQLALTWLGLFMPMVSLLNGISDSP